MEMCVFDIPAVIIAGFILAMIYAKRLRRKNPDWWFFLLSSITAIFWGNILMAGLGVIEPWFGLFPAVTVPIAVAIPTALSYPLWFNFSGQIATYLFGHDRTQAGMVWPFSLKDSSAPFQPSWKSSKTQSSTK